MVSFLVFFDKIENRFSPERGLRLPQSKPKFWNMKPKDHYIGRKNSPPKLRGRSLPSLDISLTLTLLFLSSIFYFYLLIVLSPN